MFGPNYQSLRVDRGPNVAAANGQKVKTIHPRYGSDNWVVTADRRVRLDGTSESERNDRRVTPCAHRLWRTVHSSTS